MGKVLSMLLVLALCPLLSTFAAEKKTAPAADEKNVFGIDDKPQDPRLTAEEKALFKAATIPLQLEKPLDQKTIDAAAAVVTRITSGADKWTVADVKARVDAMSEATTYNSHTLRYREFVTVFTSTQFKNMVELLMDWIDKAKDPNDLVDRCKLVFSKPMNLHQRSAAAERSVVRTFLERDAYKNVSTAQKLWFVKWIMPKMPREQQRQTKLMLDELTLETKK